MSTRDRRRRLKIALWLSPCIVASWYGLHAADSPPGEYEVKSAFLLNFIKFIEWPPAGSPDTPFAICIVGHDPFGRVLDRMVEGETAHGQPLVVQRVGGSLPPGCHIVFCAKGEKRVASLLANPPPGVLTVGEGEAFLREGGMIAFVLENRRVRFCINQPAAARAGLKLSSKLLSVARSVER